MRGSRLGSLTAALAMALVATACTTVDGPSWLDGAPRAIGPQVELANGVFEGVAWRFLAYATDSGFCGVVQFDDEDTTPADRSCHNLVSTWFDETGMTGRPSVLRGTVGPTARRIVIDTRFDGTFEVEPVVLPESFHSELGLFVAILPIATTTTKLSVYDTDGQLLEESQLLPP